MTENPLKEIGRQHDELAVELGRFSCLLFDYEHREGVAEALRQLLMDIGLHFGYEESLMDEGAYPDFEHHRRQHVALMIELGQLLDRAETMNDPKDVVRRVELIADWYQQHVAHSDVLLEDWLARRSVPPTGGLTSGA